MGTLHDPDGRCPTCGGTRAGPHTVPHAVQEYPWCRAAFHDAPPPLNPPRPPEPAEKAPGDINARLRQHVEGIKDQGCSNYGDPFSCDKQPNGTRALRPCEPCLMRRLLDRAAFDAVFAPATTAASRPSRTEWRHVPTRTEILNAIARHVEGALPEGLFFAVVVFNNEAGEGSYVSNGERASVIAGLRENADALERGRDWPHA